MYMLAGHVSEKLGKDTYENLLPSRVFEPTGMTSTTVGTSKRDVTTGNVAKPIISKEMGGQFEEGYYELYE